MMTCRYCMHDACGDLVRCSVVDDDWQEIGTGWQCADEILCDSRAIVRGVWRGEHLDTRDELDATCAACSRPAFGSILCPSCEAACDRLVNR